jgi:hypothetical protein
VTRRGAAEADGRFPGFDPLSQAPHWDQITAGLIEARVRPSRQVTFFTSAERACAAALLDDLLAQPRVPVLRMIEARLAAGETDGWRYADMPEDGQAWRDALAYLDADAKARCGTTCTGPASGRCASSCPCRRTG